MSASSSTAPTLWEMVYCLATCQMPPTPSPLTSPGLTSPEYRYRGLPLRVIWLPEPSGRADTARVPLTPVAVGAATPPASRRGGHVVAQPPVHALVPDVSRSNM